VRVCWYVKAYNVSLNNCYRGGLYSHANVKFSSCCVVIIVSLPLTLSRPLGYEPFGLHSQSHSERPGRN